MNHPLDQALHSEASTPPGLVVLGDSTAACQLARDLACPILSISRADLEPAAARWWLEWRDDRLELGATQAGAPRTGLSVDFVGGALGRRLLGGFGPRDPLAKALGRPGRRLLDATAGLGRDALLAARRGHRVLAVERSPILVALIQDGLRRAADEPHLAEAVARIELRCAEARQPLASTDVDADCVYIDPMFPTQDKSSAQVKKPMQLLQALAEATSPPAAADDGELLRLALGRPGRRVVVKRPARVAPLLGPGVPAPRSAVRGGRTTRYDIYES